MTQLPAEPWFHQNWAFPGPYWVLQNWKSRTLINFMTIINSLLGLKEMSRGMFYFLRWLFLEEICNALKDLGKQNIGTGGHAGSSAPFYKWRSCLSIEIRRLAQDHRGLEQDSLPAQNPLCFTIKLTETILARLSSWLNVFSAPCLNFPPQPLPPP